MTSGIGRRRAAARDDGSVAYRQRRDEVIRAAGEVFRRHGYNGTKVGDIAEAASMDRATVYYYVGSKDELFQHVVGDAVERNCLRAEEIAAGPGRADEKLRTLVTELMVSYAEAYPYLYVFIREDLRSMTDSDWARSMSRFNRRYENAVVAIVQGGVDEGTFALRAPAWVVGYGIIGMVAWSHRWFDPERSDVPAAEIGAAYAATVVDGLLARSPGAPLG